MSTSTTGISWTDRTWGPVVGCTKVSQGCKHCYAKTLHDMRHEAFKEGKLQNIPQYAEPFETVQMIAQRLTDPFGWRKASRVFVNSMSDLFHEGVPFEYIASVFAVMSANQRHSFQVLTKRPARMVEFFGWFEDFYCGPRRTARWWDSDRLTALLQAAPVTTWPLPNLWLGVSVENQAAADERIPLLLKTPAAVRFLSCEPLLGPIDLFAWLTEPADQTRRLLSRWYGPDGFDETGSQPEHTFQLRTPAPIDWIIVGGESGKGARPMHPDWARALRDQCLAARVPFHFKQHGDHRPVSGIHDDDMDRRLDECDDDRVVCVDRNGHEWVNNERRCDGQPPSDAWYMERVGTKRAGRALDGRTWDEFPVVAR